MTPQGVRKFKRGEFLFKEGDRADVLYIVQSGRVSLFHSRGVSKLEVLVATNGQAIGEINILGQSVRTISAEALSETTVMEFDLAAVRADLEKSSNLVKILTKSLHEKLRVLSLEVKNAKLEKEQGPCPQLAIPKVFSIINFVARHVGKREGEELVLPWSSLSMSAVRLFLESAQRTLGAVEILTKLGMAQMIMHKNEEDQEELHLIRIPNVQVIEDFAEFYQYNLYKGARSEVIYVEPICLQIAKAFVHFAEGQPVDRKGAVRMAFNPLVENIKKEYGLALKSTHIELLEKKGLFMKRQNTDDGVFVSFDIEEYKRMSVYWALIHEIDKWNERGRVEMVEKEEKKEIVELCPACQAPIQGEMKFCSNCGHKLVA